MSRPPAPRLGCYRVWLRASDGHLRKPIIVAGTEREAMRKAVGLFNAPCVLRVDLLHTATVNSAHHPDAGLAERRGSTPGSFAELLAELLRGRVA